MVLTTRFDRTASTIFDKQCIVRQTRVGRIQRLVYWRGPAHRMPFSARALLHLAMANLQIWDELCQKLFVSEPQPTL